MITVRVEGAWLLVSGAGEGELWIALHEVLSVRSDHTRGGWSVVIEQAGATEERRVFVEDEDAAESLAAEVRSAKDRAHERRVA